MKRREESSNRQQIISEYLTGDSTYSELSVKYGVNGRTIQTWVRAYRKNSAWGKIVKDNLTDPELKRRLKQAELKNELLEEMLRLSEELTGIDLRKKFGSGQ